MKTIPAWFEAQVQHTPDAIAVICGDESLTYRTLNDRANYLAAQLIDLHVKPDMQIALCMERSIEQITAIFGILKAGCAYVPLDPSQPAERLNWILKEGSISVLIITNDEHALFSDYQGRRLILKAGLGLGQIINPSTTIPIESKHLAYVIYTSGTTGTPKGVLIEHQSVVNFCQWFSSFAGVCPAQRIDWSGNYIFDMAVATSLVPLMVGSTIVMCKDEIKNNPGSYLRYLNANDINIIKISPSYFKALLNESVEHRIELPNLHTIVLGGERLLTADCRAWLNLYPEQILFNEYGPTEATVAITHQKICKTNINAFQQTYIPIGHVGTNMQCYVLNADNKAVSAGETGELHIGGLCLARGYLNQPELTRKKFIPSPFKTEQSDRLYKTGDLGRQLANGVLEFMGRIDQQVKLRGYRIELGEIEVCLRQHPAVQDAVVVVHENLEHEPLLVAYCIHNDNIKPSYTQMRKYLQQHLPDYMIPNNFVPINHFPLTANSKLDHRSLPPPSLSGSQHYVPALTELEKEIAAIWSSELGVNLIGMNDNFFELGGHSLNAARIVSKINQGLEKNIEIKAFYLAETLSDLIDIIKNTPDKPPVNNELQSAWSGKTMPLADFQLFLWMLKTFKPNARKLNIVSRKRWHGQLDSTALNAAFGAILKRHDILSYHFKTLYPAQYPKEALGFTMTETKTTDFSRQESEQMLLTSVNQLINYNAWSQHQPKILVRIFYVHDGEMELQMCLPHLISDEVSMDILWNDLSILYQASLTSKSLDIEQARSFNEYVFNEKKTIETNFKQDCIFWEKYLHNACLYSFPSEYVVQNIQSKGLGYSTYLEIAPQIMIGLEQFCAIHQIGLNAVLCAVVGLALRNSTPRPQIEGRPMLMNIIKSTRNDQAWDETIGCFIRLDPIKVFISKYGTLLTVAKQIHHSIINNTNQMQASTILKLAYIGGGSKKWTSLLKLMIGFYTKILRVFNLDYISLQLIAQLSWFNRKNDYIICVNLRNNFTASVSKNDDLYWHGLKEKNIQMYQYDLESFDNVCDVSFLRDGNQKTPYVVVSSNLKPEFRKRIAEKIIEVLNEANSAVCSSGL